MTILPLPAILRPLAFATLLGWCASAAPVVQADDARGDDGWRRTAYGWEHVADWQAPRVNRGGVSDDYVPPLPADSDSPYNLHPGLLVVVQLLGVGIALVVAPAVKTRNSKSEIRNEFKARITE